MKHVTPELAKFHKTREHDILISHLRQAREAAGVSQSELSRRLGHRVNYINRVELGRHSLDVVGLLLILRAIGKDPVLFFATFIAEANPSDRSE